MSCAKCWLFHKIATILQRVRSFILSCNWYFQVAGIYLKKQSKTLGKGLVVFSLHLTKKIREFNYCWFFFFFFLTVPILVLSYSVQSKALNVFCLCMELVVILMKNNFETIIQSFWIRWRPNRLWYISTEKTAMSYFYSLIPISPTKDMLRLLNSSYIQVNLPPGKTTRKIWRCGVIKWQTSLLLLRRHSVRLWPKKKKNQARK